MKNYTTAVFDLDGTIFDSSEGIIASLAHVFRICGCQPPPPEELFKFIGPPLCDAFVNIMGFTKERSRELTMSITALEPSIWRSPTRGFSNCSMS